MWWFCPSSCSILIKGTNTTVIANIIVNITSLKMQYVASRQKRTDVVIYSIHCHHVLGWSLSHYTYTKQWYKHTHVLHSVSTNIYECENWTTPFMTISHVVSNSTYTKSADFCVLSDEPYTLIQHSQFRNKGPCIVYQINICSTLASVWCYK